MSEKTTPRKPWWYFMGGVVTTIVAIILLAVFGILGGACAVRQCTTANPCAIGGVTYTTGNRCRAETSACGYIGSCRTSVVVRGAVTEPDCDCTISPF